MNRKWVMSFAAVAILMMGALSASAQRGGFYMNGPRGSVSVNVGGGGCYGGNGCYGGHRYHRGYYAPAPGCNNGYGYNYYAPPPPPPAYYAPAPVYPQGYYRRGWGHPARVYAYGGGYRHGGEGYEHGGYGRGGGWGNGHGGGHRR